MKIIFIALVFNVLHIMGTEAALCTFWGRAVNYQTGIGISDMDVKISVTSFNSSAKTTPEGYFQIDVLAPGQGYQLNFSHLDYKDKQVVVNSRCNDNSFVQIGEIPFRPRYEFSVTNYSPAVVNFLAGTPSTKAIIILGSNL